MFIGGIVHDASTYEGLVAKARALHGQMDAAAKSRAVFSPDVLTHMQMRALRRDAQTTLYALEAASSMPDRTAYPEIIVSSPASADRAVTLQRKNAKDVLDGLATLYKASVFVKDGGRLIYQKRPKNLPFAMKMTEQSKDIFAKTVAYGRRRPIQFAAISLGILAAKILFVLFVWEALVDGSRKLLGLKAKHKAAQDQPAVAAATGTGVPAHGAATASS